MTGLLTAVVAILVFGTVVLVHELGHFLAARRCGIRVEEFSIGFGPALWSKEKNGTKYSIRLLPIGGYNMLEGEDGETQEEEPAASESGTLANTAGKDTSEPFAVIDGRSFSEAGPWQRLFVMACGALMNFLLGFVILLVLTASNEAITSKVIYDFVGDNPKSQATGLQSGDEILSVNGHYCFTAEDVMYELQRTEDYTASFRVRRDGQVTTIPNVQFDTRTDEDGNTTMVLDFRVYGIEKTPRTVVHGAVRYFCYYARVILRGFVDLFTGRVGVNELSGPVGVVSAVSEAVQYGWRDVLNLAAVITVNLGIFNLLPIPGLDGFKLIFLAVEGITRREVPARIQAAINAAGMFLLLALMVMVTMQDVAKFIL